MIFESSTIDIRDGDTLIVHVEQFLSAEQREKVIEVFKAKFPRASNVVTLEGGMRLTTARTGSDELLTEIRDILKAVTMQMASGRPICVEVC